MPLTYDDLFGLETLAPMVERFADQSASRGLQALFRPSPLFDVEGDTVQWDEVSYSRQLAPAVGRDGPAKAKAPLSRKVRQAGLAQFKEKEFIPADMIYERALGGDRRIRENAPAVVGRAVRDITNRIALSIERLCAMALQGSIVINSATFPDSDVEYPAITYDVQSFTASASWGDAATKILSSPNELDAIKKLVRENEGVEPAQILFSHVVGRYLLGNAEIQGWLQTTQPGLSVFSTGMLGAAGGLGGIPGWTEYNGGYLDSGGVFRYFIPDDKIIVLPSDPASQAGLEMARGYGMIPGSGLVSAPSAEAAVSIMPRRAPQAGWFSYAYTQNDPVGVWVVVGWRGFPLVRRPKGVVFGDVTP